MNIEAIGAIGEAIGTTINGISSIVKTISDNNVERMRISIESANHDKEMADRVKVRDAEVLKFYKEQEVKLEALNIKREEREAELKNNENENKRTHEDRMKALENERRRDNQAHKERMKELDADLELKKEFLSIVREVVKNADQQMNVYRDFRVQYGDKYPIDGVINMISEATSQINAAAQTLMLPPAR